MSTKADFRATRETIGLTQRDVAEACDVALRTVKRWEHPDWGDPPEDAWEWILEMLDRHDSMVDEAVGRACSISAEHGELESVVITYYRDQEQYDAHGRDDGPVGFANAVAREVGAVLTNEGIEVEFAYPDDVAVCTPGSRY